MKKDFDMNSFFPVMDTEAKNRVLAEILAESDVELTKLAKEDPIAHYC